MLRERDLLKRGRWDLRTGFVTAEEGVAQVPSSQPNPTLGHGPKQGAHCPDGNIKALGSQVFHSICCRVCGQRTRDLCGHRQMVLLSLGGQTAVRQSTAR